MEKAGTQRLHSWMKLSCGPCLKVGVTHLFECCLDCAVEELQPCIGAGGRGGGESCWTEGAGPSSDGGDTWIKSPPQACVCGQSEYRELRHRKLTSK